VEPGLTPSLSSRWWPSVAVHPSRLYCPSFLQPTASDQASMTVARGAEGPSIARFGHIDRDFERHDMLHCFRQAITVSSDFRSIATAIAAQMALNSNRPISSKLGPFAQLIQLR